MAPVIRTGSALIVAAAVVVAAGCAPGADQTAPEPETTSGPAPSDAVDGAAGAGDPYFPFAGNGGIDVEHYDLDLTYTPPRDGSTDLTGRIEGVAVLRIRPTEDLSRFNLDLRELEVSAVTVDDAPARFIQDDGELVITPAGALTAERVVDVRVEYAGDKPVSEADRDGGWYPTHDGGAAINQPHGAPEWFPSNDHPTDKASYRFSITVPDGKTALANGLLEDTTSADGWTTWVWDAPDPMASYLALLAIGDFDLERRTALDGTPIIDAIGAGVDPESIRSLELTGEMMAYFEDLFGDYPFVAYGQVADDDYGTALETQTRSIFGNGTTVETTVAHELAHQWFGDWVSPGRWSDLWLNEGWALYAEWLWNEHKNGVPIDKPISQILSTGADAVEWETPPAEPDPEDLFSWAVYQRGALTIHALRQELGDEAFFRLAREWLSRYGGATATTEDFIALAEEVSGKDLSAQFDEWVYRSGRPSDW